VDELPAHEIVVSLKLLMLFKFESVILKFVVESELLFENFCQKVIFFQPANKYFPNPSSILTSITKGACSVKF